MARRFFNKEHHFNTPRLEDIGEAMTARDIVVPPRKALICFFIIERRSEKYIVVNDDDG